jgi:hypothetical protein
MALNLSVAHDTLVVSDGTSAMASSTLHLTGTLAQLNAELQTLHYESSSLVGVDVLSVNVWNQAGVYLTHTLNLSII